MSGGLEADLLLDRRRLKRRLVFWRVAAITVALAAIVAVVATRFPGVAAGRHVERVTVSGVISSDRKLVEAVSALAKDSNVAAVLLAVDSPRRQRGRRAKACMTRWSAWPRSSRWSR